MMPILTRSMFSTRNISISWLILLTCHLPVSAMAACPLSGSGTESSPYLITSYSALQQVGSGCSLQASYRLTEDIDASHSKELNGSSRFIPIGDVVNPFTGHFMGSNHTIKNLFINDSIHQYIGLFGVSSGRIDSLSLSNISIYSLDSNSIKNSNDTSHRWSAGGIVGFNNNGSIIACSINGSISGTGHASDLGNQGCYRCPSVSIISYASIGGICGTNAGSIDASTSFGEISTNTLHGGEFYTINGGICGTNSTSGIITNSKNHGNINGGVWAGGIVGYNHGTIQGNTTYGDVGGPITDNCVMCGGIAGANEGLITTSIATGKISGNISGGISGVNDQTISLAHSRATIIGNEVGGIAGRCSGGKIENVYSFSTLANASGGGIAGLTYSSCSISRVYSVSSYITPSTSSQDTLWGPTTIIGENSGSTSIEYAYWLSRYPGDTTPYLTYQSGNIKITDSKSLSADVMTQRTIYAGFDFGSIWSIHEGTTFPFLQGMPEDDSSQLNFQHSISLKVTSRAASKIQQITAFRSRNHIEFTLPTRAKVSVCNSSGRKLLPDSELASGFHQLKIPSTGVLFLTITTGTSRITKSLPFMN